MCLCYSTSLWCRYIPGTTCVTIGYYDQDRPRARSPRPGPRGPPPVPGVPGGGPPPSVLLGHGGVPRLDPVDLPRVGEVEALT